MYKHAKYCHPYSVHAISYSFDSSGEEVCTINQNMYSRILHSVTCMFL